MLQLIGSMLYDNCYLIVGSFLNVCYLIKLFANKLAFHEYLRKGNSKFLLLDFFANAIVLLAKKVALTKYISNLQSN